tara:strand:+ start:18 stop:479 length:462 start_codon:yes stop_codon:yes gene_type:complete
MVYPVKMADSEDVPYTIRIKSSYKDLYMTAKYYFKSFGFNVGRPDDENIKNVAYVTYNNFQQPEPDEKGFYIFVRRPQDIDMGMDSNGVKTYYETPFQNKYKFYTPNGALNSLIELPTKLDSIYDWSKYFLDVDNNERSVKRKVSPDTTQLHF